MKDTSPPIPRKKGAEQSRPRSRRHFRDTAGPAGFWEGFGADAYRFSAFEGIADLVAVFACDFVSGLAFAPDFGWPAGWLVVAAGLDLERRRLLNSGRIFFMGWAGSVRPRIAKLNSFWQLARLFCAAERS
jgi:hypothetical protein